ncbi:Inositol phosphoceramide mannosyltransferase 3 [Ceratocystis platani]|uniref:Inositol phosphoceramide mannosyltransferase 3 n=1 Tax=Ceratocystis fimbriata f. sp. platani TaxID=88771 RepID=A0A0F8AXV6_CERFI|nr:Inositol phosphoceramide mannosyltransferase 3 [Ceratocystis platani]
MRPVTKSSRRLLVLALAIQKWRWSYASRSSQTPPDDSTIIPGEIYTKDNSYVDDALEVRLAPEVKASEMMARPIATRLGTIPKIFHQSWIDSNLPAKFQQWSDNCRKVHSDYEWVLWTNEDNENIVRKHFPWLLKAYFSLPSDIYRADFARNLYIVYADLDIDWLRSSNVIFENHSAPYDTAAHVIVGEDESPNRMAFLGRMGTDEQFEHSIPNAWMASTPGHPFFLLPLESVLKRFSREKQWTDLPEDVTGPVALRRAILKYQKHYIWEKSPEALENDMERYISAGSYKMRPDLKHTVQLLHHDVIYPYSWGPDNYDCHALL